MSHKGTPTAATVRQWLEAAHQGLLRHREVLDALNFFPVADSDTGANLSVTVGCAAEAAAVIEGHDIGELLHHTGRAALEQARGNSGMLMALSLTAMGASLEGSTRLTADLLRDAFDAAHVRCWSALTDPVEGTMLSVLRKISQVEIPGTSQDGSRQQLCEWIDHAVARAAEAVVETGDQLPVLRDRGAVDSGALGLLIVLAELRNTLANREGWDIEKSDPVAAIVRALPPSPREQPEHRDEGFEVLCTIDLSALDAAELRHELDSAGESVLVSAVHETDAGYRWRVHVHVADPETALDLLRARGDAVDVSVTSLGGPEPSNQP